MNEPFEKGLRISRHTVKALVVLKSVMGYMLRITKSVTCVAIITAIICFLVYLRALDCGFVNLDDAVYVLDNDFITHLDKALFSWAFFQPLDFWIPLTWISFAVDYHFWKLNPFGYHLTNIALHAVNTSLVVLVTDALLRHSFKQVEQVGRSHIVPLILLLTGLFFGIHPLRVESVAWVAERKDVLNGIFTFSSLLCYLHYLQFKNDGKNSKLATGYYLLSLGLFALSLMAKASSVVMPAILLVADYYPLQRLHRGTVVTLLKEKLPYLLLSIIVAGFTLVLGGQKEILVSYDYIPFFERVTISGSALFDYCRLLFYPVGLVPYFLIPNELPFSCILKTVVIVIVTGFSIVGARKRPLVFAAWASFIIPFLPVLALFQNGTQMLAARYTYLPSLVPSILIAAGMVVLFRKKNALLSKYPQMPGIVAIFASAILIFYVVMTLKLITVWDNTEKFWTRVIEIRPTGMAYRDRGRYYLIKGKFDAAIEDFTAAIEDEESMQYVHAYNFFAFRGLAYEKTGRIGESVRDFSMALNGRQDQNYYYHRGKALLQLGREKEAREDLLRADQASGIISWHDK